MELLRYFITPEGTLGEKFVPAPPVQKTKELRPGDALRALLAEEEDEDFGDAPDVSGDFARLGHLNEAEESEAEPLTADFAPLPDGTLALVRWPRLARPAVVPAAVEGKTVTAIGATAFASTHLEEKYFSEMYVSPISYTVFCMRMGRHITAETVNEGGPTAITLPDTVCRLGPFAFWRCDNITEIALPRGITDLPVGCFGDCSRLACVDLPDTLQTIGYLPRPTDIVMPDIGVFAGCHALKALTLPAAVTAIGAYTFNSAGLVHLTALDPTPAAGGWSRRVQVAANAFDHAAALLWLDKTAPDGTLTYRVGLPVARDKILAGDRKFGSILRVPVDFFTKPAAYFDALAKDAFRLDFSGRMALCRIQTPGELAPADRLWYLALLVQYFDRAPQFMPTAPEEAHRALFTAIEKEPDLTAADLSDLLRTAGLLGLPADLIADMMEVRTQRFETVTGFEDLDLD